MTSWRDENNLGPIPYLWGQPPETVSVTDPDLDIVFRHLALESFLQSQDGRVDGVLQLQVLGVPGGGGIQIQKILTNITRHLFSRKVLPLTLFLPMAVAFQAK